MSRPYPKYPNAPVVELVLGVQFDPIPGFTSGHAGWFWKEHLGTSWKVSEAPPVPVQTEAFGQQGPQKLMFQLNQSPIVSRLMVQDVTGDRLLQVQNSRFHYNWQKADAEYPHYAPVYEDFIRHFTAFRAFVKDAAELAPISLNQWEITYIDSIPPGELWQTPDEWANVFPGLFPQKRELEGLSPETAGAQRTFEIFPQKGRLHIAADLAYVGNNVAPSLMVRTTARGPLSQDVSDNALKSAFDMGHDVAGEAFDKLSSDTAKQFWRRTS